MVAVFLPVVLGLFSPAHVGGEPSPLDNPSLSSAATSQGVHSAIIITIDTLRADRLGAYGYNRNTSSMMDAWMKRGTRFDWAFSTASYTAPSHVSLMTGLYPSFTSVMLDNGRFFRLGADTLTLAEFLRSRGFRTAAVVSNPTLNRRLGLHQGFAAYCDLQFDPAKGEFLTKNAADTTDEALILLEQLKGAPFFLWIHYQDPHGPYTPPEPLDDLGGPPPDPQKDPSLPIGNDTSGYEAIPTYQVIAGETRFSRYSLRYDHEIHYLDRQIARLFRAIDDFRLLNDTLCILTADHGEAFSEDGFYFAHSHSVGLDQVHVPLAILGPGVPADLVLKRPVSGIDLFPTLIDALGFEPPRETQGRSLWPTLHKGEEPEDRPLFTEGFSQRGIVFHNRYFRMDRRGPESPIWKISPTTNGFYKPLGARLIDLTNGRLLPLAESRAMQAELDAFATQAEERIRLTFQGLLKKGERTFAEQNGLIFFRDELGYDFDLANLESISPASLSPEEQAQRRALIGLGYAEDEDQDENGPPKRPPADHRP